MLFSSGGSNGQHLAIVCAFSVIHFCVAASANAQTSDDDQRLVQMAQQQAIAGSIDDAFKTAVAILDDDQRQTTLGQLSILRQVSSLPDGSGTQAIRQKAESNGAGGGLTEADFDSLIELITGSLSPESWLDTGSGLGTIQPFPSGIYVDARGTLRKSKLSTSTRAASAELPDLVRPDSAKTKLATQFDLQTDVGRAARAMKSSPMRIVSLNRLERQAQLLTATGKPLTDAMKNLAGLTEIQFVAYLPESNDVVIAGPGGSWKEDERGRSICNKTGKPTLQLDDLVVCLQNAIHADGKFGCAIVPRQQNLAATKRFLASSKLRGKAWRTELKNVSGQQDIEVFGIQPTTHTAYVLVEADCHMKLIGMGLEPSIAQVPSYLDRVQLDTNGSPPPLDVARWWFTPDYDRVQRNESSDLFAFSGAGVKVLSETEFIDEQGKRIHSGDSVGPTKTFAEDFTGHFEKLADKYPIYQKLKNVFDLAMAANLIHDRGLAKRASWKASFFTPRGRSAAHDTTTFVSMAPQSMLRYPFGQASTPRQVDTVMNDRMIRQRLKSATRHHTIVGVSGGVSADFAQLLRDRPANPNVIDQGRLVPTSPRNQRSTWWWDRR